MSISNYLVKATFKRVLKTTASLLFIVALATVMLAVPGVGTNKAYAAVTSSNDTYNTYNVTIKDNSISKSITIKSVAALDKDTIIAGIKNYYQSLDSNIVSVAVDSNVDISVVKEETKSAAASKISFASATTTSEDIYTTYEDAIKALATGKYFSVTTVEKTSEVTGKTSYKTIYKKTKKLRKTVTSVKRAGVNGTTTSTTMVTSVVANGKKTSTSSTSTSSTQAVSQIIYKGTGSVKVRKGRLYSGTSGQDIVRYAKKFLGNPYVYGGTSLTHGCDCSGFVQSVYKHFGLNLPRINQYTVGKRVKLSRKTLKPGDLLSYSGHVAIYAGNGKIVHAVNYGQGIKYTSMYYGGHPWRATRIVQ